MVGFSWEVEWGQICQDPLTFCPLAGQLCVDLEENRGADFFVKGINVAEESADKRFKVEWDFQEKEKIKKFVNLREEEIYIWK